VLFFIGYGFARALPGSAMLDPLFLPLMLPAEGHAPGCGW